MKPYEPRLIDALIERKLKALALSYGEGYVEFLDGDDARRRGLDIILAHYAAGPFTYREESLARTCVFRVVIESLTGKKANLGALP